MSSSTISSAPSRAWRAAKAGGIAGIDEIDELHAFDDAAGVNVEAGDDALGDHLCQLTPQPPERASRNTRGQI
jgi:hypothetical protein